MSDPTIFTITPDFNTPARDGVHWTYVRSKHIVDGFKSGRYAELIRPGARVVAYFDPEGHDRFEYEAGWSIMCVIDTVEVKTISIHENDEVLRITFHEERA